MEESVNTEFEEPKLEFSEESIFQLDKARKWSYILAVLGMIYVGALLLFTFGLSAFLNMIPMPDDASKMGMTAVSTIYSGLFFVQALIYFFPVMFLFKFSSKAKTALLNRDSYLIEQSLKNLRYFFQYIGVLGIIAIVITVLFIAFYALFFSAIVGMLSGAAGGMS
jgi:hypothetical protein